MSSRSRKIITCLAAALAVTVLSTEFSLAADAPQSGMDPKFIEMLSSFQKKASEASEAIIQNMKKGSETATNGTDQTPGLDNGMDQARKLMESLAEFQKKAFGTADSDNPSKK
jgi:hypothetical protein